MTAAQSLRELWRRVDADGERRAQVLTVLFGDRRGLALFLGSLAFLFTITRLGVFITDTNTIANAFVALTEGHLPVERVVYGPTIESPGMSRIGGDWYGRNYGQLVFSLPAYALITAISAVADLQIAIAAAWSLLLLALALQVGRCLDRDVLFSVVGAVSALVLFVGNIAFATPVDPVLRHMLALQFTSMLAGAAIAVVVYRLVATLTTARRGLVTGGLILLATPIGFWSPIPKRHVFTTLFVVIAIYALVRSRTARTDRRRFFHAGGYGAAGLLAWVHAPEGLVLFVSLLVIDVITQPAVNRQYLGTVAAGFTVSLVPMLVTNLLVVGDPFVPPRLLRSGDVIRSIAEPAGVAMAGFHTDLLEKVLSVAMVFGNLLLGGVSTIVEHPEQVYHTFVRSGYVAASSWVEEEAINLSIAESAPLVAGILAIPAVALTRARRSGLSLPEGRPTGPKATAGVFLAVFGLLLTLVYIERLPLHAQVTVRYLLPLFALGTLATMLFTPVGRATTTHTGTFLWALTAGVLLGGQVLLVVVVQLDLAVGEAFQFHALLGLATAGGVLLWTVAATLTERFDRVGAALVGVAAATVVVFSLFVVTAYSGEIGRYPVGGQQALPLLRVVADMVATV